MDIGMIQRLAFTLVAQLTKFDPAKVVMEKAEDFELAEEAGHLIVDLAKHGKAAVADGVIDNEELAGFRARGEALIAKARELGIEIIDQQLEP